MGNEVYLYIAIAVIAILAILFGVRLYLKNKKPKQKVIAKSGIAIDTLIDALQGTSNIQDVESTLSKVTVTLKDSKNVDVEKIKSLGASGIVQNENRISMIFGKTSQAIKEEIEVKL